MQPDVLQQKMREKKLTHGETVTATLSPVRLQKEFGKLVLYFCPMEMIEILETISPGDGGHIPCDLKAEGLAIPRKHKTGLYRLKNVTLTSNGMMEIKTTEKTERKRLDPKMFK